jgi:hypothetical protein
MLNCRTCGQQFPYSPHEAAKHLEKGWSRPAHCWECRRWRQEERSMRGPVPGHVHTVECAYAQAILTGESAWASVLLGFLDTQDAHVLKASHSLVVARRQYEQRADAAAAPRAAQGAR